MKHFFTKAILCFVVLAMLASVQVSQAYIGGRALRAIQLMEYTGYNDYLETVPEGEAVSFAEYYQSWRSRQNVAPAAPATPADVAPAAPATPPADDEEEPSPEVIFIVAAMAGELEVVEKALELGIDVDVCANEGKSTALMVAAGTGQIEVVQRLLQASANLEKRDNDGWTAVFYAAKFGQLRTLKLLHDAGAKLDVQDHNGWTALMVAAGTGQIEVVKHLLQAGASVDTQDNDGWTALMVAAGTEQAEIVRILLDGGANVNVQAKDGTTAMDIANQKENREIVGLLSKPPYSSFPEGTEAGERREIEVDGIKYAFRWCPAGKFIMGSPAEEADRGTDETRHRVTLTQGFWMLETEVTQEMWESVMGTMMDQQRDKAGSGYLCGEGPQYPMYYVNWDEANEFCRKLSQLASIGPFCLPTEAQWEYACRAGTTTPYGGTGNLDEMGWYGGTSGNTHEVKTKEPNAWGLYDMHGNVLEWCSDWFDTDYYKTSPASDPTGPKSVSHRVLRGGDWSRHASYCRSAFRFHNAPSLRDSVIGFRLALVP